MYGAWEELSESEDKIIWTSFEKTFNFHPSIIPKDWPSFKEPLPSKTFDISIMFNSSSEEFNFLNGDLLINCLLAFRDCLTKSDFLYVFDWQHPSYKFFPHSDFKFRNEKEWKVSVFPNGDYYIFISKDFTFGSLGHPWERTICIFGDCLINALEVHKPELFKNIKRINGKSINNLDKA
jgi:Protein of unknown function (DUF2716)